MRKEIIGNCTLYLGECMEILESLGPIKVDLLLTDPPYGIDYGGQLIKGKEFEIKTNKHGWRNFGNDTWDKERPKKKTFDTITSSVSRTENSLGLPMIVLFAFLLLPALKL